MARPRKPTSLLELKGAFKVHPERARARAHEPVPSGSIGLPPAHLSRAQKALWDDLTAYAMWLTSADRLLLEVAVVLFSQFREQPDSGRVAKIIAALSKLGFSPSDRSKVQAPGSKTDNDPYAAFA